MIEQKPVALVTGSSKGLGKFICEQLLKEGYRVVGCSRGESTWQQEGYTHFCVDVAEESQVLGMFKNIRLQFDRLDVAINNAGVASMNHSLLTACSTFDKITSINLRGTFLVSREAAKLMRKRKYGRIVNLTTVAVPMSLEGEAAYVASKAGVEGLTRVLAQEFAELNITVNAVGPSPVETDLIASVGAEKIKKVVNRLAIKRLGSVEDVYNVIEFFIRPASNYVTGQIIYLGGI